MARERRGRGEGSITQLPDGRWQARLDLGYANGRRVRKALYGRTRREVQDRLARALADRQRGLLPRTSARPSGRSSPTGSRPCGRRCACARGSGTLTWCGYTRCRPWAPGRSRGSRPRTCRPSSRPSWRQASPRPQFSSSGRCSGGPRGQALRWGLVQRNAAALTDPPRVRRPEVRPLTPAEARALLAAVRGDRLEALFTVALALGLRQGEALGLRWQDVDLQAGTLRVAGALQRVEGTLRLVEPKSARSRRTLNLPAVAVAALRAHRARQTAERLQAGPLWQEHGLVFTTTVGTPLDDGNVRRAFKRHLPAAGLPPTVRFHDLRRTAATLLLARGGAPAARDGGVGAQPDRADDGYLQPRAAGAAARSGRADGPPPELGHQLGHQRPPAYGCTHLAGGRAG